MKLHKTTVGELAENKIIPRVKDLDSQGYRQVNFLKPEKPILDISCDNQTPIIERNGSQISIMIGTNQMPS